MTSEAPTHGVVPSGPEPASNDLTLGLVAAAVAVTVWGSSGVIAKHIPMGGIALSAYRFIAYAALIGAWRVARRQPLTWTAFRHSIPGGIMLALDVALFFTAIKLTTIVNATVIGALQPVVLGIVGVRMLGEKVTRRDIALSAVALAAVVVVVLAGTGTPEWNIKGDLTAVGALFVWSGYFYFAKAAEGKVSPTDYTISAAIIVGIVNTPLAFVAGQDMSWPTWSTWGWLLTMALGAGILGHNLMNWAIVRIPLWLGGTFTLLVPVVASIAAWIFLDEPLNAVQMVAIGVVVATLYLLVRNQSAPAAEG